MLVSEGVVRLVNSSPDSLFSAGRLEIYLRGQWGTVCDDGFGFKEAAVACQQLGYSFASAFNYVGKLG